MKQFIWNEQEGRPRSFGRLLIQLIVWVGLILLFVLPFNWINNGSFDIISLLQNAPDWLRMVTLLITVFLMARFVDIRHFSQYGLDIRQGDWWQDFLVGLLLGGLTMTFIFLIQFGFGWLIVQDTFFVPGQGIVFVTIGGAFLASVTGAVYETLWIWSYTLRNTAEGLIFLNRLNGRAAVIGALVLCLILFVLFRITQAQTSSTVFISNMFRAGLLLALPFILTERLGLSIGLFIGWSVFQVNVYGLQAVGSSSENPSLLLITESGPDMWTGGETGIGSGLIAMIALLILSGIITAWNRRRTGKTVFEGALAYYSPAQAGEDTLDPTVTE